MLPLSGRLLISDRDPARSAPIARVASRECARLPLCVVFARDDAAATAIVDGGFDEAVLEATEGKPAIVWVESEHAPIRAIKLDEDGRVTEDATFSFGSHELRIAAGSRVDAGERETDLAIHGEILFDSQGVDDKRLDVESGRIGFSVAASALDASVRYFHMERAGTEDTVEGFRYPVFTGGGTQSVRVSIDPGRAFDAGFTHLTLLASQPVDSTFRTVTGSAVALAVIPNESRLVPQWDPAAMTSYLTPDGDWRLTVSSTGPTGPTTDDVLCGVSGLEFAKVPDGSIFRFVAGAPAYAPGFPSTAGATATAVSLTANCPDSEYPVTTAWVYFAEGPSGIGATAPVQPPGYYSQPERGGLFRITPGDPYLDVLRLKTADFPVSSAPVFGAPAASFPMAPYAGVGQVGASASALMRRFENEVLSPTRTNAIYALNAYQAGPEGLDTCAPSGMTAPTAPTGPMAVTPAGLVSTFSDDYSVWKRLVLASTNAGVLELRMLDRALRAALLTNQLFLVISNPKEFQEACEVYFPGLDMGGWQFALPLDQWRGDTVLILKFAERSLGDLIDNLSLWSAPGSALNNGAATQAILQRAVAAAKANAGQPEFAYFLNTVLKDWNGIIFFNVSVPPNDFPPQLRGLAAGVKPESFAAHHLGVNLSPVSIENGYLTTADSSLFGLINYDDPLDLTYGGTPYDFKVLSLRVLFANSQIASFSSRIELLVGQLFGERSTLVDSDHGDNLVLNGVWQKHGDEDSYSFSREGADTFSVESKVLDTVLITKAQFVTLDPDPQDPDRVATRFLLWGSLRFRKLPDLDVFSFGPETQLSEQHGLQFSNLFISMTFSAADASIAERKFAFEAGQTAFDPSGSIAREQSLYARFPMQVSGLVQGDSKTTPASLGYIPLTTPLRSGSLGSTWYGLTMPLSLGSQGSLAAKAGFTATLLAAWSPRADDYNAIVALKLPGSDGGKKSLTIEGPLKLDIGDIALLFNPKEQSYLMRFENISLGLLSLKFPPGGRTNLLLFGDPNPKGPNTTLGWYAAYKKDDKGPTGKNGPAALERTTWPTE